MFEEAKGMKICKTILTIFFVAFGYLFIDEKVYLVSQCHVKKIAVKFAIFYFNKYIFFYYFFMICDCFFHTKKIKIYKD